MPTPVGGGSWHPVGPSRQAGTDGPPLAGWVRDVSGRTRTSGGVYGVPSRAPSPGWGEALAAGGGGSHRVGMSLASLLLPLVVSLALPPGAAPPAWSPPITPLVIERSFQAPAGPYSPGHRGVDLAAVPGTVVRAPAAGTVRFAGRVAGKAVVSVEHAHRILGRTGWRTTYEGVQPSVEAGDRIRTGDPLGVVIHDGHSAGIHWGLKNGRAYADPLLMLRRPVVLKPLGDYARGCACS
jgi:murein DD-endopeptidase MepM/ murein hydrolase activator NlpD